MRARRAVIFDMDGVLILSGEAHWTAWSQAAAAQGVPLSRAQFLALNGLTNVDTCRVLFGADLPAARLLELAQHKEAAWRAEIARSLPLAPGCRELLAALRARGARLALGSSAPVANVDQVLDAGALRPLFDAVVHGDMVARGKPAPDIFLRAAELLGAAPGECVVVEDAPTGIRAAAAAGMPAVGVASNHDAAELRAAGAVAVAAALRELPVEWLLAS